MYSFLKHTHLTLILVAVILFVVNFYWLKTGHKNAQKPIFQKMMMHTHVAIFLLGASLLLFLQLNPFAEYGYWALEKMLGFVAYLVMVKSALNESKSTTIQVVSFLGAFGWLAYIGQLAITKQAILLVG